MFKPTVLVTGGNGLVGNAIRTLTWHHKDINWEFVGRNDYDLIDFDQVIEMYRDIQPQYVIHTAARVGGIGLNLSEPADQFTDNILINTYVIDGAWANGIDKLIAFGSVCAYPGALKDNLEEGLLHYGPPFPAHGAYAYAKRMVQVMCEAYNKQHGTQYCTFMPGNMFGPCDNFNLENGHVVPSLIHKAYLAKNQGTPLEVWGDGSAEREFLSAYDVASACIKAVDCFMTDQHVPKNMNISSRESRPIKELVEAICQANNYYNVRYLDDKPVGQTVRRTNLRVLEEWWPERGERSFGEAVKETVEWFNSCMNKGYPVRL